jgi:hypothetical protein
MERISLPIPAELLQAIDRARGDVPRTVWIRRAIEARLNIKEEDQDAQIT